ncbi:MAG: 16S rRNA (guanine(966)-N(2))-methyltransferase RsmD [Clostridia bacterium]|nr:16S rRNA (guanine(966)-N(2))-methyltransferase RsmD [Clostridia bacterium]
MRIIAGSMRSRTIVAPKGNDTRPTLDRTRESLFSIIAGNCIDARVLDLYAGSGALALESISRGAESAVVCDCSREAAKAIRQNIETLKLQEEVRFLFMQDLQAVALLGKEKAQFDLVFLDPPYRISTDPACKAMAEAGILMDGALVVIEHDVRVTPAPEKCYELIDKRQYRDTVISFYQFNLNDTEEEHGGTVGISGQL